VAERSTDRRGWGARSPRRAWLRPTALLACAAACLAAAASVATAQPRYGGELVFAVGNEPPSLDGHREGTFALMETAAPHYNTLLRIEPNDRTGTGLVPDLAESWTVSKDARTYTLRIRRGVKFHDGSDLTSADVKASFDKIVFPPPGVASTYKGAFTDVEAIQAPDPFTVVFRLKWPSAAFLASLAMPNMWVYKADILAKDMRWYETHVMGTGPFTFVEYVRGSHWTAKKNPNYWDKGKPYLDGYRAIFMVDPSARVAAVRGDRAMIDFRGMTPGERDTLVRALGPKATVQENAWNCNPGISINHEKKPFDDKRVRRALTLALDRYAASQALSKIAIVKEVAGVQLPGTKYATPPDELAKLAGYSRDIAGSRAEARRLLREAGVPEGFSFTFLNRALPMPNEPIGVWLLDQWRQIGLNVKQNVENIAQYYKDLRGGNFEVAIEAFCSFMVEPSFDLARFQSPGLSDDNMGRYTDKVLDDLYVKQARATDVEERRRYVREYEKRLLSDEAHVIYTLAYYHIVAHNAKVKGWTLMPSHLVNQQLDTVWLAE
jgi:peptide/nickel transport system substrate-binding protein